MFKRWLISTQRMGSGNQRILMIWLIFYKMAVTLQSLSRLTPENLPECTGGSTKNATMTAEEFNSCVDLHADNLYRFILKNMKDKEKARDVVQDTYEKLWLKVS